RAAMTVGSVPRVLRCAPSVRRRAHVDDVAATGAAAQAKERPDAEVAFALRRRRARRRSRDRARRIARAQGLLETLDATVERADIGGAGLLEGVERGAKIDDVAADAGDRRVEMLDRPLPPVAAARLAALAQLLHVGREGGDAAVDGAKALAVRRIGG